MFKKTRFLQVVKFKLLINFCPITSLFRRKSFSKNRNFFPQILQDLKILPPPGYQNFSPTKILGTYLTKFNRKKDRCFFELNGRHKPIVRLNMIAYLYLKSFYSFPNRLDTQNHYRHNLKNSENDRNGHIENARWVVPNFHCKL